MTASSMCVYRPVVIYAADKTFTLAMAQKLALTNNRKYKQTKNKIAVQQTKYVDAVNSIQKRKKSLRSFRWTPLLSFKFPQDPKEDDEFTWMYKPLQIQTAITSLRHQLSDLVYASKEEVSLLYVDIYVSEVKIEYLNGLIEGLEREKERVNLSIAAGTGNANDIRKIDNSLKKFKSSLAKETRAVTVNRNKMKKLTGMDISNGYKLSNPFLQAQIPRSALDKLVEITKNNDHDFFVTKTNTSLALSALQMNHQLMKKQYGHKMDNLSPYIAQAYAGKDIDIASFQSATNSFIEAVDRKWKGSITIIFFSFSKDWFMGDTDGSRYIEDSPYALATSAGDYVDALNDEKAAAEELETSVKADFENIISAWNAYQSMHESNAELYKVIEKDKLRNIAGELTLDELTEEQNELGGNGLDEIDLLAEYTKLLYSYDRKTCGGITQYLAGAKASIKSSTGGESYKTPGTEKPAKDNGVTDEGAGGDGGDFASSPGEDGVDSYLEADKIEGAYYYIESQIENRMFSFGVSIPSNSKLNITHYELWVNDTRIGQRTKVGDEIRHMTLTLDNADKTSVKLYSSGKLVDICKIDSSVNRAELDITASYNIVRQEKPKTVATFKSSVDDELGLVTFKFKREEGEQIAKYVMTDDEGNALLEGEHYNIDEDFSYLSIITSDLTKLRVQFYDASDAFLYTGHLLKDKGTVVVYPADME